MTSSNCCFLTCIQISQEADHTFASQSENQKQILVGHQVLEGWGAGGLVRSWAQRPQVLLVHQDPEEAWETGLMNVTMFPNRCTHLTSDHLRWEVWISFQLIHEYLFFTYLNETHSDMCHIGPPRSGQTWAHLHVSDPNGEADQHRDRSVNHLLWRGWKPKVLIDPVLPHPQPWIIFWAISWKISVWVIFPFQ